MKWGITRRTSPPSWTTSGSTRRFLGILQRGDGGHCVWSRLPERLKALVGTGSLRFADLTELPKEEDPAAFIRKTVDQGGVGHEVGLFMQRDNERFPEAIDRNVREGDPLMYALDDLAWSSWPGPKSLYPTFETPVLMITGEREDLKHKTEMSVAVLPNARVVRIPGLGHLATFYRSDLALPHAIPFLQKHLG